MWANLSQHLDVGLGFSLPELLPVLLGVEPLLQRDELATVISELG